MAEFQEARSLVPNHWITEARVNPTSGILEHRHGGMGWHWPSVRHSDAGDGIEVGKDQTDPIWNSPPTPEQRVLYKEMLRSQIRFCIH